MGTALDRSESETNLSVKASSYEVPAWTVDGMDVMAVEKAAHMATDAVRAGGGPYFLELQTYRFRAHSMFDPELYRRKEEVEDWKQHDPISTFADNMQQADLLTEADFEELTAVADAEVARAVEFAEAGTWEPVSDLTRFVTSEPEEVPV